MGQVLIKQDAIGALTNAGSTIFIGASAIILYGQQFNIPATSLNIGSPTANTLYYLYYSYNGSAISFVQSLNPNSIGPAGAVAWKLVGAYYSNGRSPVAFGAFVNIEGVPESGVFAHTPVYTSTGGGMSVGTILLNDLFVKRIGDLCFANWVFRQSVAGVAGAGDYQGSLPFTVDSNKAKIGLGTTQGNQGSGRLNTAAVGGEYGGYIILYDVNNFGMFLHDESTGPTIWSSGFGAFSNTNMDAGGNFNFPVSGWSNTPLKYL